MKGEGDQYAANNKEKDEVKNQTFSKINQYKYLQ